MSKNVVMIGAGVANVNAATKLIGFEHCTSSGLGWKRLKLSIT